jgi:hypothetical protein
LTAEGFFAVRQGVRLPAEGCRDCGSGFAATAAEFRRPARVLKGFYLILFFVFIGGKKGRRGATSAQGLVARNDK